MFQYYHDECGDSHGNEGNCNSLGGGLDIFIPREGVV